MSDYVGLNLKKHIEIGKLFTVHYFEYSSDFNYIGESHDFWEFLYVDKGKVLASADGREFELSQGEIVFHKPNEWHTIKGNLTVAANSVVVSFECRSPAMKFFENKVLKISDEQKLLISKIISEYKNAFSTPLNDVYTKSLKRNNNTPVASEQFIKLYLTEFLLLFFRKEDIENKTTIQKKRAKNLVNVIVNYMQENLHRNLTLNELVTISCSNRTTITNVFNKNFDMSPINYFISLKIELAKKHLREGRLNVTQIAQSLGYQNIQYFSRQFKEQTGMSPQEYSRSIKAMND